MSWIECARRSMSFATQQRRAELPFVRGGKGRGELLAGACDRGLRRGRDPSWCASRSNSDPAGRRAEVKKES